MENFFFLGVYVPRKRRTLIKKKGRRKYPRVLKDREKRNKEENGR